MRLALCVDALTPQPGGIGRYTWELVKGLSKRGDIDALHCFGHGRVIDDPSVLLASAKVPKRRRIFHPFDQWRLSRVLRSSIVHGPNYFLPTGVDEGVVTVHDLSVFHYPKTHPPLRVRAFERFFASSLERAVHIITDTETVRRELIEKFAVRPEIVTAIHLGVDARFRPRQESSPEKFATLGLTPGKFGLCVSTLEPRKKILELLSAWERLPDALRAEFPLVLAGGAGWQNEDLHKEINRGVERGWLRLLGFVDDAWLPELYSQTALFIYPSIYEGFGLPPIEAMASGVPVIVADCSCLPEVCGGAARYVNPDDTEEFTSTIADTLLDAAWRGQAIKLGLERASGFSWERCVEDTIGVYRNVINSG
jgi:glycosyltransferase involved in cell wall biosynthesis